ncbi:unnamed protein product [Ascophyllum nodosum]
MTSSEMKTHERKFELGISVGGRQRDGTLEILSYDLFRGAIAEFIGMMIFLFNVITVARLVGERNAMGNEASASILLIAFEFGLSIFVLVYILAHASGAHLNPAVSLGLLVGKRISLEKFVIYFIVQVLGSLAGAAIATTFLDSTGGGYNAIQEGFEAKNAFGGEILCTFLLVLTVFASSDGELGRFNTFTGPLVPWAVGMAVLLAHLIMVPIDGCSINPARSFATAVTNNEWDDHWVFWAGPLIGGALATIVWEAILRPAQAVESENSEKELIEAGTA